MNIILAVLEFLRNLLYNMGINGESKPKPEPTAEPKAQPEPNLSAALTQAEQDILAKLNPIFADKVKALLTTARGLGLALGLFSGFRSFDEQRALYAKGRDSMGRIVDKKAIVTYAPPGMSLHNFGLAVDIVFDKDPKPGLQPTWVDFIDTNKDKANDWLQVGQIGIALGLTWGGTFRNPIDCPHFQYLKGIPDVATALALYKQGGLKKVWEKTA